MRRSGIFERVSLAGGSLGDDATPPNYGTVTTDPGEPDVADSGWGPTIKGNVGVTHTIDQSKPLEVQPVDVNVNHNIDQTQPLQVDPVSVNHTVDTSQLDATVNNFTHQLTILVGLTLVGLLAITIVNKKA
jgi:hypothetical protein